MQILNGIEFLKKVPQNCCVTIGNFDGVHRGHREILTRLVEGAKSLKGQSILMTFYPHPRKVLFSEKKLKTIFPREDLEAELKSAGVDIVIFEPFSRELSQMSPEDFFKTKIYKPISPAKLIVGYDFAFGANRMGNLEKLKGLTDTLQIDLEIVPPVKVQRLIVSSTQIRACIEQGDIQTTNQLLGRSFYLRGMVVKGEGRGRKIGFPTANLRTTHETFPKTGVYITQTLLRGQVFKSVTNIGVNPTFQSESEKIKIETHILDFNDDIYGEEIKVEFLDFIRDEKKFESVSELTQQIQLDIQRVRRLE